MKIRVNNKNGEKIAECELWKDEYNNLSLINSSNIKNVYTDVEQGKNGFDDVIDIDIDNIISSKKMQMIQSITSAWTVFETLRSEYQLDTSDDVRYVLEILIVPKIYGYINEQEYNKYKKELYNFLKFDGISFMNSEYDYYELDNLIKNFNRIYNV